MTIPRARTAVKDSADERGAMGVRLCLLLFFQLSDIDALTLALTY